MGGNDPFEELADTLNEPSHGLGHGVSKLDRAWMTIADACRTGEEVTHDDLATAAKMDEGQCRRTLALAEDEGLIEKIGEGTYRPM